MGTIQREYAYGIIPFYRASLGEYVFFIGKTPEGRGETFWKFPKGHKDHEEEDDIDAALRELKEETGIELSESAVIQSVSFVEEYFFERKAEGSRDEIVKKQNTFWLGQVSSRGSALPEVSLDRLEFSEYRWTSFGEVLELLPDNSKPFFGDAHAFLVRNRV